MVTQVPLFTEPLPDSFQQSSEEFEVATATLVSELNPRFAAANAQAVEVNALSLNAESAAGELANAVWVSGTTYATGNVRYSPVDYLNYRRKTNGAGTTDPSLDPTNWALLTKTVPGGADTTSSAVDITLTSTSGRLQVVSMTAANKIVTLPAATAISKGSPVFIIHNIGAYRFAVRKNGGAFLCNVNPGQVLIFGCSDNTTSAGIWSVNGGVINNIYEGNTAEVLNAIDSREISVAMLSATKAICCFKNNSTTFLNAVILNFGSASGAVSVISAEAVRSVRVAALSATKAVVVYKLTGANSSVKGYVLDISGNTIAPGAVQTINTQATAGGDGMSLTALSATQLLVVYARGSVSTYQEKVLDVAGTTITPSAEVVADTSNINNVIAQVAMVSATKGLMAFLNDLNRLTIRLQTITGSTPAPSGSALTIFPPGTALAHNIFACVLTASRAIIIRSILNGGFIAYLIDISGFTPALLATKHIPVNYITSTAHVYGTKIDANHVYLSWPGGYDGVDSVIITITNDDRILIGDMMDRIETGVASSEIGYLSCVALDATHIMQACRNASTFLSAKTIEINP